MSKKFNKINDQIRVPEVRLVGDNIEVGIYTIREARNIASNLNLDLVEISPTAKPPVCRVVDFKKFLFDLKKKAKDAQKKQKVSQTQIKEIRLTPNTDDHDFNFKVKNAIKFLKDNNKVKVSIFFKGRQIIYQDAGQLMILKFVDALEEYGVAESMPKLEGKRMMMFVKPKSKK